MKPAAYDQMDSGQKQKFLFDFIKARGLAVIATLGDGHNPEASLMGFAVNDKLEILCGTFSTSRKSENLKKNSTVALVIGWEGASTVQYQGHAEEVAIEQAEQDPLYSQLENAPSITNFINREFEIFYKIQPVWVRFTDMSVDPWQRFEIKY